MKSDNKKMPRFAARLRGQYFRMEILIRSYSAVDGKMNLRANNLAKLRIFRKKIGHRTLKNHGDIIMKKTAIIIIDMQNGFQNQNTEGLDKKY